MKITGAAMAVVAVALQAGAADRMVLASLSNDWRACAAAHEGKALQGLPDTAGSGKWFFGYYATNAAHPQFTPKTFSQMTVWIGGTNYPCRWKASAQEAPWTMIVGTNTVREEPPFDLGWTWHPSGSPWSLPYQWAVARWVAGTNGRVVIEGHSFSTYPAYGDYCDGQRLHIFVETNEVVNRLCRHRDNLVHVETFCVTQAVSKGQTVDFCLDPVEYSDSDVNQLDATILLANPGEAAPSSR